VAAEAKSGRPADFDFPAERAFPLSVVVGHGLLASTTATLVLLAMLGWEEADAGVRGSWALPL
jgi:hypothetical protein